MKKNILLVLMISSFTSFVFPKDISPVLSIRYDNLAAGITVTDAIGCSISGSGPSIFALCENESIAKKVISEMETVLNNKSINFHSYISSINTQGIEIL